MEPEVFTEKITNLVNEFTKNIDGDYGVIDGNNIRIIYKKTEKTYRGEFPDRRFGGAELKHGYKTTYCCECGKPIYYNGHIVPTHCSCCDRRD